MSKEEKLLKRKEILEKLNDIHHLYCEGCFVKSTFRKEVGKTYAQSFCITKCTVGEKIKRYGEMLLTVSTR
ncbi:zinc-finger domain-containing protein [Anoxybacillus sp. J5B_2022]|uniref:zinc-finger domain-containing protein n=1 Tax=Anoxybacillus sp. J5B_2022 TaxID=3003246 RepID=UPI0022866377|nr:zinc-finger domain-containing protein [Anoxybacillus sp. J5B_2022]MCZ0754162.1 zinc-finger domain-containing protein [Anoxybacillus sp. J5B_2022]